MNGIKKPFLNTNGNTKVVTPKGVAEWAKVQTPDTKYVAKGEYSVTVILSETDAQEIKKIIDAEVDNKHAAIVQEFKEKKKFGVIKKAYPYTEEYDANGNPTGNLKFKFKCKAEVDLKDGKTFSQKPVVVDAANNPCSVEIWNGSIIKVSGEVIPFYTASVGAGATLRLKAVQVIDLKTKSNSSKGGSAFGFTQEQGFVASEVKAEEFNSEENDFFNTSNTVNAVEDYDEDNPF